MTLFIWGYFFPSIYGISMMVGRTGEPLVGLPYHVPSPVIVVTSKEILS
jgi:hypothetical protein